MNKNINTKIVIIGAGPSGYSAAFRCSDLNMEVVLVDNYKNIGGVCLNFGCIPSKSLLHISKIIENINKLNKNNIITNNNININLTELKNWKNKIIENLSNGLLNLANIRKIKIIHGKASFINRNLIKVEKDNDINYINFDYAIIATGSKPINLSCINIKNDSRIWTSTEALSLKFIPKKLLIIGGGIIGLEIATIYYSLGSTIDIVETSNQLMSNIDKDIINLFTRSVKNKFNIIYNTKVINIDNKKDNVIDVKFKTENSSITINSYDAILIAIGRKSNIDYLNLNSINIKINDNGCINVNTQMRTNIKNIFAIGDVSNYPMLAHKGMKEGHIAAEVIYGKKRYFDFKVIPYIAYTDPEIAWVGITENIANLNKIKYETAIFPWSALGKANALNNIKGFTKLIFDASSNKIIGGAIIGEHCGELLGEITLAIEMGCYAEDISLTMHAHPTLYESISLASEIYSGTITDLINIKSNKLNI